MRELRLDDVTVAGVEEPLSFVLTIAQVRTVIVPASRIRAVADVLVGLKPPQSGRVSIDGWPVSRGHHRARQHGIRLVPSDGGLLPNLTVLRNLLYTECEVERRPRQRLEKEVRNSWAVKYELNDVLDRYPHQITLGRRRMGGLARAMRADPSVVVLEDDLDAPTWTALLGMARQPRDGDPAGLLDGVAAVLVTSDATRAPGLEDPPSYLAGGLAA